MRTPDARVPSSGASARNVWERRNLLFEPPLRKLAHSDQRYQPHPPPPGDLNAGHALVSHEMTGGRRLPRAHQGFTTPRFARGEKENSHRGLGQTGPQAMDLIEGGKGEDGVMGIQRGVGVQTPLISSTCGWEGSTSRAGDSLRLPKKGETADDSNFVKMQSVRDMGDKNTSTVAGMFDFYCYVIQTTVYAQ